MQLNVLEYFERALFFRSGLTFTDEEKLPIGFPCRNTAILILNEQNQPVKLDEPGELCVRGNSLALGYALHHNKASTAFTAKTGICN